MEQKVSLEIAQAEVEKWMDEKQLDEKKRISLEGMAENMVHAIRDGVLSIDENCFITQKLKFPLGNNGITDTLVYKPRITEKDLEGPRKLIKGDTFSDACSQVIVALTGAPVNVIRGLDKSTDKALADCIATFFL